jgi:hypothetical protein
MQKIPEMSDHRRGTTMNKPYAMMTPLERTTARIAQNRAITEKIADSKSQLPPKASSTDFVRATPEEQAKRGGLIRKVPAK